MSLALTLLYAPADRPGLVAKAFASRADVVLIDLEDAVAAAGKGAAREALPDLVSELLREYPGREVQVRVNSIGTKWCSKDLDAVSALDPAVAVRVPKVESEEDIATVAHAVGARHIHALLESALGIENAFRIASAGITGIGLGEADLKSSLGIDDDAGLLWARSRLVNAARASGLCAPAMSAFTNLADEAGLRESCSEGRRLGFMGRVAIHPKQLSVIEQAFLPSEGQLERAREVLASIAGATAAGRGVVVLADGRFLDAAMVQRAEDTVALAERPT
ncbi:MAG: CoA ester lyase [Propionibacteriaceae bacterium]|nr:CoA ester lyase [Propionibacteriaceae bacterium]